MDLQGVHYIQGTFPPETSLVNRFRGFHLLWFMSRAFTLSFITVLPNPFCGNYDNLPRRATSRVRFHVTSPLFEVPCPSAMMASWFSPGFESTVEMKIGLFQLTDMVHCATVDIKLCSLSVGTSLYPLR